MIVQMYRKSCACGYVALAAVLVGGAVLGQEEEIDLERAIDLALRQNRDLKMLELTVNQRQLSVTRTRADFRYTVRPEAEAAKGSEDESVRYGFSIGRKLALGTEARVRVDVQHSGGEDLEDRYRNTVKLELHQPLLRDFGRLVNLESVWQAESRVMAGRRELELKRTDLVVRIAELHEELVKLQRRQDYDRQSLERLERFVRLTRARERQGRATHLDVLRAELRLGNAQVRLNATLERLEAARAEYAELLGLTSGKMFIVRPGPVLEIATTDLETATATALSNRLDYAQILQDRRDALRGVKIARRNLWPDVRLISSFARIGDDHSAAEAAKLDDTVWFVGLAGGVDWPQVQPRTALESALISEQICNLKIETIQLAVKRQVAQNLLAYRRALADVPLEERNYRAAWDRLRLARRMFDMGRTDSFSVANAEDENQDAEDRWAAAEGAARVAAYRLLRVLGTLIEYPEDLKPGAAL